ISALFMPALMGVVADKWVSAQKLYGVLHLLGAVFLWMLPTANSPEQMFWIMMATMVCYMPTLSLAITVAYNALKQAGFDVIRDYPPIRVWGTIGFRSEEHTSELQSRENL